jgi:hypothetical protein
MGRRSILAAVSICSVLSAAVNAATLSVECEDFGMPMQETSAKQIETLIEENSKS